MELFTFKVVECIGLIWRPEFFMLVAVLYNIFLVQVLMQCDFSFWKTTFLDCVYA